MVISVLNERLVMAVKVFIEINSISEIISRFAQSWLLVYSLASRCLLLKKFFLMVLGFELRASCLLCRHCITRAVPPFLFIVTYFWIGSCTLPRVSLDHDLPIFIWPPA
jgi:hypothetical protein